MSNQAYRDGWDRVFAPTASNDFDEVSDTVYTNQLVKTRSFQKLPDFINKHSIFNNIKQIKRIFPHIGLKNCLEPLPDSDPLFVVNGKKLYIGFSSGGTLGLWDIATMSMRGVCSCMHWQNTHSKHLIGSITDPFLGIIYITDNEKTAYGISFRRRALVRFVWDVSSKEYKLFIERVYLDTGNTDPAVYANKDNNEHIVFETFKKFLKSKINSKYKIVSYRERSFNELIPRPTSTNYISFGAQSMSDSALAYRDLDDPFIKEFACQD